VVFFGGSDLILSMTLTGLVSDKARAGEQTRFLRANGPEPNKTKNAN
jgi:hypothetical protein